MQNKKIQPRFKLVNDRSQKEIESDKVCQSIQHDEQRELDKKNSVKNNEQKEYTTKLKLVHSQVGQSSIVSEMVLSFQNPPDEEEQIGERYNEEKPDYIHVIPVTLSCTSTLV